MIFHLNVVGLILIGLALTHVGFPKYFKWADECSKLSLINREMMYVHTFFLALGLLLMGLLCLTSAAEIAETAFGKKVALGIGIFWAVRLLFQFFVYSAENWRGKRFETTVHILFIFLWAYLTCVFLLAALL